MNNSSASVRRIVIVGGGTAGWLSAAYLQRALRTHETGIVITVVESPDVPSVGVGEATLLSFRDTLAFLGVDELDWLVQCNATFKLATRFCNWKTGQNDEYWVPFRSAYFRRYPLLRYWHRLQLAGLDRPFSETIGPAVALCQAGKAPKKTGFADYQGGAEYAYNMDALLVARYLKGLSVSRGVRSIIDSVIEVMRDAETGAIQGLVTRSNGTLNGELYLDCTGFSGLLINKALAEPFQSYRDVLFCDEAIAVNIPQSGPATRINPYVTATALDAGWVWQTPLYGRSGNGYVYSSEFLDADHAEGELRRFLGVAEQDVECRRLKMRVGRTRRPWVRNCVSIGLSSGFVEPLQSTGIFQIEAGLQHLARELESGDDLRICADRYSSAMTHYFDGVRDLIVAHYLTTERQDTAFWNACRTLQNVPDTLQAILETAESGAVLSDCPLLGGSFGANLAHVYSCVLAGMGRIPRPAPRVGAEESLDSIESIVFMIDRETRSTGNFLPDHARFLTELHQRLATEER